MRGYSDISISSYPEGEAYGVNIVFLTEKCCISEEEDPRVTSIINPGPFRKGPGLAGVKCE
jgi:hypothetical protein